MSKLTAEELQRKGGQKRYKKYGKEGMAEMGRKSVQAQLQRDPEYFKKLSQKGLEARRKKSREKARSTVDKVVDILSGK